MTVLELLNFLTREAKEYRKDCANSILRNKHMNQAKEQPSQDTVDAILTDFINRIASRQNVDLALYTKDLT